MKRRLGAILIGLSLTIPIVAAAPVSAHVGAGWSFEWGSVNNAEGETVSGIITNHLSSRRTGIEVTATWKSGDTVMEEITVPALMDNLAAHATSPFRIFNPAPVEADWALTVAVSASSLTLDAPVGGLGVQSGEFVGDTSLYEGQITNEGGVTATDVEVYGYRTDGSTITDVAASEIIDSIDPGQTLTYSILFDDTRPGEFVRLIAQTTSGAFLTSWNNYFGDLGNSNESAVGAIAWMADEGITTGCGNATFCPKDPVTRAQMAVFLSRALELGNTTPVGFTDIGHLSQSFQNAINALANAGITGGCDTNPLRYCPSRAVTRGQMSKFIVTGYGDEGGRDIAPTNFPNMFTDDDGHFSEPYNNAMAGAGITSGCAAGRYCPNVNVTREQMAIFMMRASELPPAP